MIDRVKSWALWANKHLSFVLHGLFVVALVLTGYWLAGELGAATGFGAGAGFYARREFLDGLRYAKAKDWVGLADSWLDFAFPVVVGLVLLSLLT